jgi:predicted DCC family thiol-disulfide oxidoreductase YuxK
MAAAVLFYDGVCGLCDRIVRFVLRHDRRRCFRFAPLQGDFARATLARHGRDARQLDSVCLLIDGRLLEKSDAVLAILGALGGVWRLAALPLRLLPRRLRDGGYDWVARHRYRWFGRFDECPLPTPELRARLAEAVEGAAADESAPRPVQGAPPWAPVE